MGKAFEFVSAEPWAIADGWIERIAAIAQRQGEDLQALEGKVGRPLDNTRKVEMRGDIAVIPVTGPIFRYANLFSAISGATSYDMLAKDLTAALEDPSVRQIVLNIDSPGGTASGTAEFAAMIAAADKPVTVYAGDTVGSAAYWIASAADRIVVGKTASVGSVGVIGQVDVTKKDGTLSIVSSQSPKKVPDYTTESGRQQLQSHVDEMAKLFIEDVAAGRGVTAEKVMADFGQGGYLIGEKAVAAGMADRVGTFEGLIAELAAGDGRPGAVHGQRSSATTENVMAEKKTETAPEPQGGPAVLSASDIQAQQPDAYKAIFAAGEKAGREAGLADGAKAERDRIFGIEAQALPGHEDLVAQLKADGQTSPEQAAMQILKAERETGAGQINKLKSADAKADVPASVTAKQDPEAGKERAVDESLPLDERIKKAWDDDADVRAEFGGDFDGFAAYVKADEGGLIRLLKRD